MDSLDEAARRLTELEIKASFTEDLLDQLNQVIVRQQQVFGEAGLDFQFGEAPCGFVGNP